MRTILALVLCALASCALADSDKLPTTPETFQSDLKKALTKGGVHEQIQKVSCLEGNAEKRSVCTYKISDAAIVLSQTEKGGSDITLVTTICSGGEPRLAALCLGIIMGETEEFAPSLDKERRTKIMEILLSALPLAQETSIKTEDVKFILQNNTPVGIWFHIGASDYDE